MNDIGTTTRPVLRGNARRGEEKVSLNIMRQISLRTGSGQKRRAAWKIRRGEMDAGTTNDIGTTTRPVLKGGLGKVGPSRVLMAARVLLRCTVENPQGSSPTRWHAGSLVSIGCGAGSAAPTARTANVLPPCDRPGSEPVALPRVGLFLLNRRRGRATSAKANPAPLLLVGRSRIPLRGASCYRTISSPPALISALPGGALGASHGNERRCHSCEASGGLCHRREGRFRGNSTRSEIKRAISDLAEVRSVGVTSYTDEHSGNLRTTLFLPISPLIPTCLADNPGKSGDALEL
jgi:hypothetical protein